MMKVEYYEVLCIKDITIDGLRSYKKGKLYLVEDHIDKPDFGIFVYIKKVSYDNYIGYSFYENRPTFIPDNYFNFEEFFSREKAIPLIRKRKLNNIKKAVN